MAYRNPRFMLSHALRDAADGSVTVFDDTLATDDPRRLYDGLVNSARSYTFGTAATGHFIAVDTGAGIPTYNRLIIPAGHNLGGETYVIEDDDNSGFTSATSKGSGTFPANAALIDVPFTVSSQRYLRLRITSSSNPTLSEVVFTKTLTTDRGPDPSWTTTPRYNVNLTRMRSGEGYALKLGQSLQAIVYTYNRVSGTDLAVFQTLEAVTDDGAKPFYLDRTDDGLPPLYVRLVEAVQYQQDRKAPKGPLGPAYRVRVSMVEEIA